MFNPTHKLLVTCDYGDHNLFTNESEININEILQIEDTDGITIKEFLNIIVKAVKENPRYKYDTEFILNNLVAKRLNVNPDYTWDYINEILNIRSQYNEPLYITSIKLIPLDSIITLY